MAYKEGQKQEEQTSPDSLLSARQKLLLFLVSTMLSAVTLFYLPLLSGLLYGPVHASNTTCQDYAVYSTIAAGRNTSTGPLKLPMMRPPAECRTWYSAEVEKIIVDMKERIADPDLAVLFENTFPNTLDTTIKYFNETENVAFVITGDITAQWLRDTGNQIAVYQALAGTDPKIAALIKAIINTESIYISKFPYCGAFQPLPETGIPPSFNEYGVGVVVNPPIDNTTVFECKYELDSLAGFLKLSRSYYQNTGDTSFINENWTAAMGQIFRVIEEQSYPTFDANGSFISYFNWTGTTGSTQPPVNNQGNGEPHGYTGMVATSHRPSDDLSTFAFLVPANAMLVVELNNVAEVLESAQDLRNISSRARGHAKVIEDGIWKYGTSDGIFAYEVNGLGSKYMMDDANVPSLLSLPYLGFLERNSSIFQDTKKFLLSKNNPYYSSGPQFYGIGGPHYSPWHPWPMSHVSTIFSSDDDDEILQELYAIGNSTDGLGLIHEAQSIYLNGTEPYKGRSFYTRPWFAWANSYFAEAIIDLAARKPHLIFKDNTPYIVGQ